MANYAIIDNVLSLAGRLMQSVWGFITLKSSDLAEWSFKMATEAIDLSGKTFNFSTFVALCGKK